MIELDRSVRWYVCHPCTSFGDVNKNKAHENWCVDNILLSQLGGVYHHERFKNALKLVRPLADIPQCMPEYEVMRICRGLLDTCGGIILCGEWTKSMGCMTEYSWAISGGLDTVCYEDVVKDDYR